MKIFLKNLIQFLKIHFLNAFGLCPFADYDKRHLSRQIVLLITLSPIVYLITVFSCKNEEDKIKVGQTWKRVIGENNPYRKPSFYYQKVINIQGDYVQYIQNEKDTLNDSKRWFVISAELVEDCH